MVRRRSPPLQTVPDPLPAGWRAHDGGTCPIDAGATVAVWMRSGSRHQGNRSASYWDGWDGRSSGSCWIWEGDGFDIVAYRPSEPSE